MSTPQTHTPPVIAVITAAGSGSRLGAGVPKAFVPLKGMVLLDWAITGVCASGVVSSIVVAVPADLVEDTLALLEELKESKHCTLPVQVVVGGKMRADSVWEALKVIDETHPDAKVLVHDCARALTPPAMIARVATAIQGDTLAVVPVVPVTDTIKTVKDHIVVETPARMSLRAAQTPQGFNLAALKKANMAYHSSNPTTHMATDDASLMEWAGHRVHTVDGDLMALKITTPEDLKLAELLVAALRDS